MEDAEDLCRVTVVSPRRRFDISLPVQLPFSALLPTILDYSGRDLVDADTAHDGWVLQRLDERPFPEESTPTQASLRHGETLYLRPAASPIPPISLNDVPELTDVVDPLAVSAQRSDQRERRAVGFFALAVAAVTAGVVLVGLGAPCWPQAVGAGGLTLLALASAAVCGRTAAGSGVAVALAVTAFPFAFLTGWLGALGNTVPAATGPLPVAVGLGTAALVAGVALATVKEATLPALAVLIAIAVGALCVGAASAFAGLSVAGVAALTLAVALTAGQSIPPLALRLAWSRIRLDGPGDIEAGNIDARQLQRRAAAVRRGETVLGVALGLVALAGEIALAFAPGRLERTTGALAALAVVLLARRFQPGPGRTALLVSGSAGLCVVAATGIVESSRTVALVFPLVILVVVAAIATVNALPTPPRLLTSATTSVTSAPGIALPSPAAGAVTVLEVTALVALFPLALEILGILHLTG